MAYKFIVMARIKGGKDEMLAGPSVDDRGQKEILEKNVRNEKFEEVQRFMLTPHTRAHHPAATLKMEDDIAANEKAAVKADSETAKKEKK